MLSGLVELSEIHTVRSWINRSIPNLPNTGAYGDGIGCRILGHRTENFGIFIDVGRVAGGCPKPFRAMSRCLMGPPRTCATPVAILMSKPYLPPNHHIKFQNAHKTIIVEFAVKVCFPGGWIARWPQREWIVKWNDISSSVRLHWWFMVIAKSMCDGTEERLECQ